TNTNGDVNPAIKTMLGNQAPQFFCQPVGILLRSIPTDQHKFFSAPTGKQVVIANVLLYQIDNPHQHPITDCVAIGIINRSEEVHIQHDQRQRLALATPVQQSSFNSILNALSIKCACEG